MDIGQLAARITADSSKYVAELNNATKHTESFGNKANHIAKVGLKAFAVGAGVVTGALAVLTARQMKVIDSTSKTAATLGIAIDKFQAAAHVADEAGINQEAFTKILDRSQKSIMEAARGTETYTRHFKALNLDAKELINLKPDEQFERIAEAMSGLENDTQRSAIAMDLFGNKGRAMLGMLDGYKEKFAEAERFNKKFNITLNAVDAKKVEEANDAMGRVGKAIGGLGNTLATELAPVITAVSGYLLEAGIDGESFGSAVRKGMEVAGVAIDIVRHAILGMRLTFNAVITGILDATGSVLMKLSEFDQAMVNTLNKIPGVSLEASKSLEALALNIGLAASEGRKEVAGIVEEMKNFESTADKIARAQEEATARAQETGEGNPMINNIFGSKAEWDEAAAARLQKLQESFLTEQELAQLHYEADLQLLTQALQAKQLTEESFYSLREQAREKHEQALADIAARGQSKRLHDTQKFLSGIVSASDSGNKKMFAMQKAASIAQALISARETVVDAYRWGNKIGGPKFGAAMASIAGVAQASNIAAIKSTSFGSGGGVTAAGGNEGTPIAAQSERTQQQPTQTIRLQGVNPDSLFTGRQIIEMINEAQRNGSRIQIV